MEKIIELENRLEVALDGFKNVSESYSEKANELEKRKIELIDTSKRDSVEKQLMASMQNSEELQMLFLTVESLRRKRDTLNKEIDVLKTLISLNQTRLTI